MTPTLYQGQAEPTELLPHPAAPSYDVEVLREHVRHLERRIRQLHAAAQLAAVAAPEARMAGGEKCWCDQKGLGEPGVSCGDCPTRDYPAADDSLKAQAPVPLSEPCALDQGARPVPPEPSNYDLLAAFVKHSGGPSPMYRCIHCSQTEYGLRNCLADHWKACRERGIAPPVAQPGSTK